MLINVKLKNCKSIKKLDVNISNINCLIGINGVGKSTFIKSIEYFYQALDGKIGDYIIIDQNNPYNDYSEVELTYDFNYFINVIDGYRIKLLKGEIKSSQFMDYIRELSEYTDYQNHLTIKLLINRNGEKTWFPNLKFEIRKVLKTIYPFYFISQNSHNHSDWSPLWDMIGDLAKLPNFNLEADIELVLKEHFGSSYSKIIDIIQRELKETNIIVNQYSNQEKFLNTIKLQLGGENLNFKYKNLSFFSDGTNSYNYLKLFCSLVIKLGEKKLKIPILFLDEPEIGLHPKFIDDLMSNLINRTNKNQIFIVTHSSRILKNIIKMTNNYNILHAIHQNDYANITIVNQFIDHREKNVLSDEEASYYFSNTIVFVEGNTELELFNNRNILKLFPDLRKVDFYSFDADTVNLSTIHPKVRNMKIPFLILVDSDYIFEVNLGYANIKTGKDYLNPLDFKKFKREHDKELFHFGENRKLKYLRDKIYKMSTTYKYSYNKYWFTVYGTYFEMYIELIKSYCINYHVYPVSTTIEGTIVNKMNVEFFKDWLKIKSPYKHAKIDALYNLFNHPSEQASAFRLIVKGKYDTLQKMSEQKVTNNYPLKIKNGYLTINNLMNEFDKTNGWVTEFIDYVFENIIYKEDSQEEREKLFHLYFPELSDIIKKVYICK